MLSIVCKFIPNIVQLTNWLPNIIAFRKKRFRYTNKLVERKFSITQRFVFSHTLIDNELDLFFDQKVPLQNNAALYRVVVVRLRWHPPTIAYVKRCKADGLSKKDIIRSKLRCPFKTMRLYTELSSSDCDGTRRPSPMLNVAKPTDFQRRTSSDALSASSPENSTTFFPNLLFPLNRRAPLRRHKKDLTVYRSINALAETVNGLPAYP